MINSHHYLRRKLFHQLKQHRERWSARRATNREDNGYNFITSGRNKLRRIDHIRTDSIELKGNSKVCSKLCDVIPGKTQLQWMVGSS